MGEQRPEHSANAHRTEGISWDALRAAAIASSILWSTPALAEAPARHGGGGLQVKVSRRPAEIRPDPVDGLVRSDLGWLNGIYLNGQPIDSTRSTRGTRPPAGYTTGSSSAPAAGRPCRRVLDRRRARWTGGGR
jgi:hypothetical protein